MKKKLGKFREIFKNRSNVPIIFDILTIIGKEGAGVTDIIYDAKLSGEQKERYLNYLLSEGFIIKKKTVIYQMTEKGEKLFQLLRDTGEIMGF
jgi:predicted transcriptional regulator